MILVLLAGGVSFLLTFVTLPLLIKYLVRIKMLQKVREEGPATHRVKSSTPTMGGIVILAATTAGIIAVVGTGGFPLPDVNLPLLLFLLLAFLGNGLIGLADDLAMVRHGRPLGLKARHKIFLQMILTGFLLLIFSRYYVASCSSPLQNIAPKETILPLSLHDVNLGWTFFPLFFLVFLSTTNAVNLTDGLDGLAAGTVLISLLFFLFVSLHFMEETLSVFLSALAGSLVAFLWYNRYPARIFMGDSGSLALGGALAASAFATRTPLWLLLVGGIFVVEALSVIVQVAYFKATHGKRIFKMSPLHHHFEVSGVPEPQVTTGFWVIQAILLAIALLLLHLSNHFFSFFHFSEVPGD